MLTLRCANLPDDQNVSPHTPHVLTAERREIAARITHPVMDAMFGPPITGTPERAAWDKRRDQRRQELEGR